MGLPELKEGQRDTLEVVMDMAFHQLMCLADYMNDTDGKVESEKYADFIIYALYEELKKRMDKKGITYPSRNYE